MSIYISNSLYISGSLGDDFNINNPIIGYNSVLLPENITAEGAISARPAVNAWTPDTAQVWEGGAYSGVSATLTQYLVLENANNEFVDYIGIARHNFYTGGYTVTVQASNNGSSWDNVSTPTAYNSNDAIIYYFNARSESYFRVKIEKTGTDISAPIVGHIKLGTALVLQRRIYVGHKPANLAKNVKKSAYGSENGQYLGQVVQRSYYMTDISQENNTPNFVRSKIVPFINHVNGQSEVNNTAPATFFFAWRPGDYPAETVYGWTNDNIQPENQGGDQMGGRMSWTCSVEAVV